MYSTFKTIPINRCFKINIVKKNLNNEEISDKKVELTVLEKSNEKKLINIT